MKKNGFRIAGRRKMQLINNVFARLNYLGTKGINTKYFLKRYLKFKTINTLTTKELTGLISKIEEFTRTSV